MSLELGDALVLSMYVTYQQWVDSEAALIVSDGCSKVSGFQRFCCLEHDLAFHYAKDPRDAYRRFLEHGDRARAWRDATSITFEKANQDFRRCHERLSRLGWFWWVNPANLWRWRGVVRLSRGAWDAHRARDAREAAALET